MSEKNTGFGKTAEDRQEEIAIPIEEVEVRTMTLGELGHVLPVGVFHGGERLQDFTLAPHTGDLEIELEEFFSVNSKQGIEKIRYVMREFLPKAIVTIGGKRLVDIESDPRRLIDRMYVGDIFSILLAIRIDRQEGSEKGKIALVGQCPRCQTKNKDEGTPTNPYHDLYSVQIKYYALKGNRTLEGKPVFDVTLPDGFDEFGVKIKTLRVEPLRFRHLVKMADPKNKQVANLSLLSCVVTSLPDQKLSGPFVFDRSLYAKLLNSQKDKKAVFQALDKLQPGPEMAIEMICEACSYEWEENIPWPNLPSFLYGVIGAS
jgi:hypothetical protein